MSNGLSTPAVFIVRPLKSRQAINAASRHNARTSVEPAPNVEKSETHLNRALIGTGDFLRDYSDSPLSKVPLAKGKLGIHAAELILTARADWFNRKFPGWKGDPDLLNEWADRQLRFLKDSFGNKCVSAVLHLDEDAPHLHVLVIPVAPTFYGRDKEGRLRVCDRVNYRAIFGDAHSTVHAARAAKDPEMTKLGRLHTAYARYLDGLGLKRGQNSYLRPKKRSHTPPGPYRKKKEALVAAAGPAPVQPLDLHIPEKPGVLDLRRLGQIGEQLRQAQQRLNEQAADLNERDDLPRRLAVELQEVHDRAAKDVNDLIRLSEENRQLRSELRALTLPEMRDLLKLTPDAYARAQEISKSRKKHNAIDVVSALYGEGSAAALARLTRAVLSLPDAQEAARVGLLVAASDGQRIGKLAANATAADIGLGLVRKHGKVSLPAEYQSAASAPSPFTRAERLALDLGERRREVARREEDVKRREGDVKSREDTVQSRKDALAEGWACFDQKVQKAADRKVAEQIEALRAEELKKLDDRKQEQERELARQKAELDSREQAMERRDTKLKSAESAYQQKEARRQEIVQSKVNERVASVEAALEKRERQLEQRGEQLAEEEAALEKDRSRFQTLVAEEVGRRMAPKTAELSQQAEQLGALIRQATTYRERHSRAVDRLEQKVHTLGRALDAWRNWANSCSTGWDVKRGYSSILALEADLLRNAPAPEETQAPAVPEMPDWLRDLSQPPSPSPSRGSSFRPR